MISTFFEAAITNIQDHLATQSTALNKPFGEALDDLHKWLNFSLYIKTSWKIKRTPFKRDDINQELTQIYTSGGQQRKVFANDLQMQFLGQLERAVFSAAMTPTRALGHVLARQLGQQKNEGVFVEFREDVKRING